MRLALLLMMSFSALAEQPAPPADLEAVRAEPRADRRYWKALEYGSSRIDAARKSYQEGPIEGFQPALAQTLQSVQLCDDTLRGTGKNPSKSPKHFKRAELRIREMIRRLQGLEELVSVDDRAAVTKVRARIQSIHDELLLDIMGRKNRD
jgi:hypothetical protein